MRLEDAAKYAQINVIPQRQKGVIHISAGGPGSGRHPKHPEATYDPSLSDKNTAGFSDKHGEQYHMRRSDLPDGHPNKMYTAVKAGGPGSGLKEG